MKTVAWIFFVFAFGGLLVSVESYLVNRSKVNKHNAAVYERWGYNDNGRQRLIEDAEALLLEGEIQPVGKYGIYCFLYFGLAGIVSLILSKKEGGEMTKFEKLMLEQAHNEEKGTHAQPLEVEEGVPIKVSQSVAE